MTAEAKQGTSRDDKGRFKPGHSVKSPGRPTRQTERLYLQALWSVVDLGEWEKACAAILAKAQSGDVGAFRELAKYVLPNPELLLRIESEENEFRVAGRTAAEVNDAMLQRLASKIKERRDYESSLRQNGIKFGAKSPTD